MRTQYNQYTKLLFYTDWPLNQDNIIDFVHEYSELA